ncbi:putative membrane protein [Allocatelliglobosispora scoriae]|uniref:Putative membrane protein n=1 Tax=Allocatelliglobosispora scoriae TaxID=643052 RepID=A0A841BS12_9ACTN|nr:YibE/F family protein [Allocatelliglobosispora scoriae]MBB5871837.1 putative membrane protein [Allocatelliglobosispora scoriae]
MAIILPLVAATLIGLIVLWPHGVVQSGGEHPDRRKGEVTAVTGPCPKGTAAPVDGSCGSATVDLGDGKPVVAQIPSGAGAPRLSPGDKVIVIVTPDPEDPALVTYSVVDHQRGVPLILLLVVFAAAVIAFGRWRGLAALGGLVVSFAVLLIFLVPAIRAGEDPLMVALVAAGTIMFAVLYLTHGVSVQTSVAVIGTLTALILTGLLGMIVTSAAQLTGFGTEEAAILATSLPGIDLRGLLVAGIIIGSLGVLDDVTVTQASAVAELGLANPSMSAVALYRAATRIGRAHIASTVNTIILAYAGASLPLFLLIAIGGASTESVLTSEAIAMEIVRSVVATLGLIAAVPITTGLAAVVTALAHRAQPAAS